MTVPNTAAAGADVNNTNKRLIFKTCAPFINCISQINKTQLDNAKDIDIEMPMYNVIEYSDNYSKTSGSLWQHYKDIPVVNNGNIAQFNGANATDPFNFQAKITGQAGNNGWIEGVEIMVPLKYLQHFWRTLEMPLINCEILTWSGNCVIVYTDAAHPGATFAITKNILYVPVVTLSTQDMQNYYNS